MPRQFLLPAATRLLLLQGGAVRLDGVSDAFQAQFAGDPVMGEI
ncbi:hypothetical protein [Polaromonas sp. CG9_12]|nr:hypothetical protein [Polaromonas sp. CG9_12]